MDMDVPAQSYGMPINGQGTSLMLISDSKYGYRGTKEGLSLTLIRSSVEPDPWPEIGKHRIQMAIAMCDGDRTANIDLAHSFCRGFMVTAAKAHKGKLPPTQSLVELSDNVILSALKIAEDGSGVILRYYEPNGSAGRGTVKFFKAPKAARAVNLLEQPVEGDVKIDDNTVSFEFCANGVGNLLISF
jgi:alpha-mannosidase